MAYIRCAGDSGGSIQKKTATGAVATFNTGLPAPLIDVTSAIGYRSNGYTSASVINSKTTPVIDETPYHTRIAPSNIGDLAMEKLVGVSCVFNQLVENGNFSNGTTGWLTRDGATITANDNVGTVSFSSASISAVKRPITMVQNHVYFIQASVKGLDGKNVYFALTNNGGSPIAPQKTFAPAVSWGLVTLLGKMTQAPSNDADMNCVMFRNASGEANTIDIKEVEVIDLTAMFGSTVADYLSTLESGTSGSGVALFKSLFGEDYYPYTSNTLISCKPLSKVIKDSNNQTVQTIVYSGNELRGLLKAGTNGLYADGDIDDGSGSVAVRYEERAYQSGDESLTDAITDGTNTVVKLASPTTASSTAWSNPIKASAGGTETFVDTRTIALPTGHDTIYGTDLSVNKAEFGTTVYGGSVDFTTGEVISNKNADGTDKTAESISITPVPIMANFGANNLMSDTNGDTTVQYLDLRSN